MALATQAHTGWHGIAGGGVRNQGRRRHAERRHKVLHQLNGIVIMSSCRD